MRWRAYQVHAQLLTQSPEKFEEFIAALWKQQGWKTELTQGSSDAGIDVIAERTGLHSEKAAIQAKRYAPSNKVGRPEIQQYDTLRRQDPNIDFVIIATTSEFTNQATKLAEQLNVKLVPGGELAETAVRLFTAREISEFFGKVPPNTRDEVDQSNSKQNDSMSHTTECNDENYRRSKSNPEDLSVSQLADSLSKTLSEDDLSEKERMLSDLYEHYWEQRNEKYNGTAGSSLVFNFDQAEYVEVYQMLVGLHSISTSQS